jgi:hypothetical protein
MTVKLDLSTPFVGAPFKLGDFWQWAYSDVMNNRNRSILAEWLVGSALGVVDQVREEWDGCDLSYSGLKIEVKSTAYLQSWQQRVPSKPIFDIAHKRAWISEKNERSAEAVRYADVYVFSLFKEMDRANANVLGVNQWEFYVVATKEIDERYGIAKSLSLKRLRQHSSCSDFFGIKSALERVSKSSAHELGSVLT